MSAIKAVIDTQVFLRAAINLKSLPAKIVFQMRSRYLLIVSEAMLVEVRDVLNRPKIRAKFPQLTDTIVEKVINLLSVAEVVTPADIPQVSRDPKDDIFLAAAKASGANYIVSEDNDLLALNPHDGIQIINVLGFLHVLENFDPENSDD